MSQRRTTAIAAALLALLCGLLSVGAVEAQAAVAPPRNYVVPSGSYFSYPNRGDAQQVVIRKRVLYTIQSVWGATRDSAGVPLTGGGTIRIATWSFDDWAIAKALVAARNRGVSVQVMAAAGATRDSGPWNWLQRRLGTKLYRTGYPSTASRYSFARECRGSCRGPGGTAHAKYFLFDDVGLLHARKIVFNTSMNLTRFAVKHQWNQAQVLRSARVYDDFLSVFNQARLDRAVASPYHVRSLGSVTDLFFPRPGATAAQDPVMQLLGGVACTGATGGGTSTGRTRIRVIQYAIYGDRGTWIAKRLRYLWNRGCQVKIIYSVSSRPVLQILRSKSGRGPVPMRQSVIKNSRGEIVTYNHSKWMTVTGHYGASTAAYLTFTGSANWADLAFGSDEQMQRISGYGVAGAHLRTFDRTWKQRSSRKPPSISTTARLLPPGVPLEAPTFGTGIYKFMTED